MRTRWYARILSGANRLLGPLLLVALASGAFASVIYRASFDQYCQMATEIVQARVIDQVPVIPQNGMAHTLIRVEVKQAFKGQTFDEMTLVVPGATLGDRTVTVSGSPQFLNGEEVVLFLWKDFSEPSGSPRAVLGLVEGTYRTRVGPDKEIQVQGLHAPQGEKISTFAERVRNELVNPPKDHK